MERKEETKAKNKSERLKELEKMIEESGFKFGQNKTFKPAYGPATGDNDGITFSYSNTTCLIR